MDSDNICANLAKNNRQVLECSGAVTESSNHREPARMRGQDGEWGAVKARDSRSTQAVEAKSKFMRFAPAQVQVSGRKCEYLVCFDRCLAPAGVLSLTSECSRTGMPHPFDISLIDKEGRSGTHQIEVSHCPDTSSSRSVGGTGV